jgi:predicted site-specific integrase-resolvase
MARLGIGEKALRRLTNEGRLPVVKLGKTSPLKFRQQDVARLLESSLVGITQQTGQTYGAA